jgi:hypothetical protein
MSDTTTGHFSCILLYYFIIKYQILCITNINKLIITYVSQYFYIQKLYNTTKFKKEKYSKNCFYLAN